MFEKFTDRARRVVRLVQEEAAELRHTSIGTEHLLLALISEGEGVAYVVLDALGVTHGETQQSIVQRFGRGTSTPPGHIEFGDRAKKALELAFREALQQGHNYIGTEHILLGILRERDGLGAQTLVDRFELSLHAVRQEVMRQLSSYDKPQAPAVGGTSLQLVSIDERDHAGALLRRSHTIRGLRHAPEVRLESEELLELLPLLEQACERLGGHSESGDDAEDQVSGGD